MSFGVSPTKVVPSSHGTSRPSWEERYFEIDAIDVTQRLSLVQYECALTFFNCATTNSPAETGTPPSGWLLASRGGRDRGDRI
jgi:hypothetical protein